MSAVLHALLAYMLLVVLVFLALLKFRPRPARSPPKSAEGVLHPDDKLYDSFRRHDQYGKLGADPQPLLEYLRLALFLTTIAPLKFIAAFSCVFGVHVMCRVVSWTLPKEMQARVIAVIGKAMCHLCLLCLGFSVEWTIDPQGQLPPGVEPAAIVSNHISYMDIIVHLAHSFPSFVARGNTKDMPLLGLISQHLQCIYVNREFKKGPAEGVSGQVKERMEMAAAGKLPPITRPLLLFPEGTTTNGLGLLPFKSGAFLAGAPVQPVILRYGAGRVSPAWESVAALWHVLLLLANPTHSVTARQLPLYVPSQEEKADPKLYAANVRALLLREGGFFSSEASLLDSRAFISLLRGKPPPPASRAGQALGLAAGGKNHHAGAGAAVSNGVDGAAAAADGKIAGAAVKKTE